MATRKKQKKDNRLIESYENSERNAREVRRMQGQHEVILTARRSRTGKGERVR